MLKGLVVRLQTITSGPLKTHDFSYVQWTESQP